VFGAEHSRGPSDLAKTVPGSCAGSQARRYPAPIPTLMQESEALCGESQRRRKVRLGLAQPAIFASAKPTAHASSISRRIARPCA
jgi:hypothetical protein